MADPVDLSVRRFDAARGTGALARFAMPRRVDKHASRVLLAACLGAGLFATASGFGTSIRIAEPLPRLADRALVAIGFGVGEINLSGHKLATDDEIYAALGYDGQQSILTFDVNAARARIETVPWVARAVIERRLPETLAIRVSERKPAAMLINREAATLVDRTGRKLAPIAATAAPDLLRITGPGAAAAVAPLLDALEPYTGIRARVALARRVGERRWTLQLADGPAVLLPEGRDGEGLRRLDWYLRNNTEPQARVASIDLRRDAVVTVRLVSGPGPAAKVARSTTPAL